MFLDAGDSHCGYLRPSGHSITAQVSHRPRMDVRTSLVHNAQLHSEVLAQRKVMCQSYLNPRALKTELRNIHCPFAQKR